MDMRCIPANIRTSTSPVGSLRFDISLAFGSANIEPQTSSRLGLGPYIRGIHLISMVYIIHIHMIFSIHFTGGVVKHLVSIELGLLGIKSKASRLTACLYMLLYTISCNYPAAMNSPLCSYREVTISLRPYPLKCFGRQIQQP